MESTKVLNRFINERYVYRFSHGPNLISSKEQALREGINCVSLAHLALRDLFDITLPSSLMCSELHKDRNFFESIDEYEPLMPGDLVWFGVQNPVVSTADFQPIYENGELINWREYPVKHVTIAKGETIDDDELLLHSTSITGTNSIWPMSKFKDYARYQQRYGVTRLVRSTI